MGDSSQVPEKVFQTRLLVRLREIPGTYWFKSNDRTTAGIPDIIGCVAGVFFALELKTKSKVSPIQAYHLRKIDDAAGQAFVVTPKNVAQVLEFIRKIAAQS